MNDRVKPDDLAALKIDRTTVQRRRRRTATWWVWLIGVALVAMMAGGTWWVRPTSVKTAVLATGMPARQLVQLTATGHVVARVRATVATKASGRLVEMLIAEGATVKRGDLLARIESGDVQAALSSSEAGVNQARAAVTQAEIEQLHSHTEYKRNEDMAASGFVSQQAVEQARSRADSARAALEAARAALSVALAQVNLQKVNRDMTEIRAPIDGTVLSRHANVGDVVSPLSGVPGALGTVLTMADLHSLGVDVDVSESQLSKVVVGQPVELLFDALPNVTATGLVTSVLPAIDRASATITARIAFNAIDPRVLPDMSVKVNFLSRLPTAEDRRVTLSVPTAALSHRESGLVVFRVVEDGADLRARAVAVRTGHQNDNMTELMPQSDLKAGDRIVLAPSRWVKDGGLVRQDEP